MHVILAMYSLFRYRLWCNYSKFSDKIGLAIRPRMLNNAKHRDAIYLEFGDRFFTSLTMLGMLGLESKDSTYSVIKENLLLYCHKFSVCCRYNNLRYSNEKVCLTKKHCL